MINYPNEEQLKVIMDRWMGTFKAGPFKARHGEHMKSWITGSDGDVVAFGMEPEHAEFFAEAWQDVSSLVSALRKTRREHELTPVSQKKPPEKWYLISVTMETRYQDVLLRAAYQEGKSLAEYVRRVVIRDLLARDLLDENLDPVPPT